eukprot:4798193-Ditylum_brightwellii.AAC.1
MYDPPEISTIPPSDAFLQWTDSDMKRDAQLAMPSVLASDAGIVLVNAPRSHLNYRLPPRHFNIGINCHLILPLHHHKHNCLCGKTIDVCGNHYFLCKHLSKKSSTTNVSTATSLACAHAQNLQ